MMVSDGVLIAVMDSDKASDSLNGIAKAVAETVLIHCTRVTKLSGL